MRPLLLLIVCLSLVPLVSHGQTPSLPLTDYHYHILKGGVTPATALEFQRATGIRCGVLQNIGRNERWLLRSNDDLKRFIELVEATIRTQKPDEPRLLIGLQVNDRDWYAKIDLKLYRRIDYILADTMFYTDKSGEQHCLWKLPKDHQVDLDQWMDEYFAYNMRVLGEPIDILANPTYLPAFAEDKYDDLWTDERMKAIIQKAIDNNIAFEIPAESKFPKPKFIALALKMGAKFTFGSNSTDGHQVDRARWYRVIEQFNIKEGNLWRR
jgi:hypothetical protein